MLAINKIFNTFALQKLFRKRNVNTDNKYFKSLEVAFKISMKGMDRH